MYLRFPQASRLFSLESQVTRCIIKFLGENSFTSVAVIIPLVAIGWASMDCFVNVMGFGAQFI